MIKTLMYHKVEDFAKWKEAFDGFAEFRRTSGEKSYSVGTLLNEPNTAYVINEWESIEAFNAFVNSPELGEGMKSAGVTEAPNSLLFNEVDKG